jgi:two-component system chemotaxis response regulator CheY
MQQQTSAGFVDEARHAGRDAGGTRMALNVLVVDDSAVIRKVVIRALSQTGVTLGEIQQAADGKEALVILRACRIDLVLSDINMPNMDGIQLLEEMQKEALLQVIPVIMITTEGSQSKVMDAAKLGAKGLVRKPFVPEQIKQKMVECLDASLLA